MTVLQQIIPPVTHKLASLRQATHQNPSLVLAFIALASGLIYGLAFTARFPLHRLYTTIPPVDYAKLTHYTRVGLVIYVLGTAALFALVLWAFTLTAPVRHRPDSNLPGLRFILATSAGLAVVNIPAYPLTAIDLFIYAIRTRGWGLYGLNPLATAPQNLPADPWLGLAGEWVDAPSPYGPLWEWLSLAAYHLTGGDFLRHLFALKLVTAAAYLTCVWLVYLILTRARPAWAVAGTLIFAWNPLVLLESVQNGHNDILMTCFLLAAIAILSPSSNRQPSHRRALLALLLLALSILIKYVTIIAAPFFLLWLTASRHRRVEQIRYLLLYGLVLSGLVILAMRPLWPGWEVWAVPKAGSGAGRSLIALLILGFRAVGIPNAFDLGRGLMQTGIGLIYLYYLGQALRAWWDNYPLPAWSPAFFVLFWYVLLAAPVFHAWYLLWFVPLASLFLPHQRPLTAVILFSVTALLVIPYFETIRVWYPVLLDNHLLGHLIGVPLLIVPPIVAIFWPRVCPEFPGTAQRAGQV